MRFFKKVLTIVAVILLCGCVPTGRNDMPLFINRFNEIAKENQQIDETKLIIHTDSAKRSTYYKFFDAGGGCEYVFSFSENEKRDITSFSICITNVTSPNKELIKSIFESGMYALYDMQKNDADTLFSEVSLDKDTTYKTSDSTKKEADDYTIEVMVSNAGCSIYVY